MSYEGWCWKDIYRTDYDKRITYSNMKKIYVTLSALFIALSMQAQTWVEQLKSLNPDLIDSVVTVESDPDVKDYHSYYIYYHQPLQHDVTGSDKFQLRAVLTVPSDVSQPQAAVTQVYFSGYNIDASSWKYPDWITLMTRNDDMGEISGRYNGNFLQLEHRYFEGSAPAKPWTTLGYCHASEAAADFHAIIHGLKKVFTGKWVISGISKGGITAAMQHAFYPDDADFFVPYVGPFCNSQADPRMHQYWMSSKTWTPELHAAILHIQKEALNRPSEYELFKQAFGSSIKDSDSLRCTFVANIVGADAGIHSYSSRQEIADMMTQNKKMIDSLGYKDYSDEMLFYIFNYQKFALDRNYINWYKETFEGNPGMKVRAKLKSNLNLKLKKFFMAPDVFGITEDDWYNADLVPYFYQAGTELGYYDMQDFSYYYDKQADADSVATLWKKMGNYYQMGLLFFNKLTFDSSLRNFVLDKTKNATKPITFIYGGDDTWTGSGMDDDCINGSNVRKYILEGQNHGASITAADASTRDEIFAYMDKILGTPASIQGVNTQSETIPAHNCIYNLQGQRVNNTVKGQMYIVNGKKFIKK